MQAVVKYSKVYHLFNQIQSFKVILILSLKQFVRSNRVSGNNGVIGIRRIELDANR